MFRTQQFNPYCQWLGLALPPNNHFELLGLARTTAGAAAIQAAAQRQIQKLAQVAEGPIAIVKKLQVEIRLAERCLLDPDSRSEYDRRLRGERSHRVRWRTVKVKQPRVQPSGETVTDWKSHITPAA
jgi:hypothetical protein